VVQASTRADGGVRGFRFLVQSAKLPPSELLARVETFLAGFGGTLAGMPAEKFRGFCVAAARDVAEPDKNMESEAGRLADEVTDCRFVFNRASRAAAALLRVTQDRAVQFFADVVAPGGAARATFASMIAAGADASASTPARGAAEESGDEEEGEVEEGGAKEGGGEGGGSAAASPPAEPRGTLLEEAPLEAVAVVLAARRATHAPLNAAAVSAALRGAGLRGAADACGDAAATGTVLRLPVRVTSRESVHQLLPTWPNFAAQRVAQVEGAFQ
jgi:hypothetical protein